MKRIITVTWRAFSDRPFQPETSATFTWDTNLSDKEICEKVFRDTNLYEGEVWDKIEPLLPEDRTHTALSVIFDRGDYVEVDGIEYEVQACGFKQVTYAENVFAIAGSTTPPF